MWHGKKILALGLLAGVAGCSGPDMKEQQAFYAQQQVAIAQLSQMPLAEIKCPTGRECSFSGSIVVRSEVAMLEAVKHQPERIKSSLELWLDTGKFALGTGAQLVTGVINPANLAIAGMYKVGDSGMRYASKDPVIVEQDKVQVVEQETIQVVEQAEPIVITQTEQVVVRPDVIQVPYIQAESSD